MQLSPQQILAQALGNNPLSNTPAAAKPGQGFTGNIYDEAAAEPANANATDRDNLANPNAPVPNTFTLSTPMTALGVVREKLRQDNAIRAAKAATTPTTSSQVDASDNLAQRVQASAGPGKLPFTVPTAIDLANQADEQAPGSQLPFTVPTAIDLANQADEQAPGSQLPVNVPTADELAQQADEQTDTSANWSHPTEADVEELNKPGTSRVGGNPQSEEEATEEETVVADQNQAEDDMENKPVGSEAEVNGNTYVKGEDGEAIKVDATDTGSNWDAPEADDSINPPKDPLSSDVIGNRTLNQILGDIPEEGWDALFAMFQGLGAHKSQRLQVFAKSLQDGLKNTATRKATIAKNEANRRDRLDKSLDRKERLEALNENRGIQNELREQGLEIQRQNLTHKVSKWSDQLGLKEGALQLKKDKYATKTDLNRDQYLADQLDTALKAADIDGRSPEVRKKVAQLINEGKYAEALNAVTGRDINALKKEADVVAVLGNLDVKQKSVAETIKQHGIVNAHNVDKLEETITARLIKDGVAEGKAKLDGKKHAWNVFQGTNRLEIDRDKLELKDKAYDRSNQEFRVNLAGKMISQRGAKFNELYSGPLQEKIRKAQAAGDVSAVNVLLARPDTAEALFDNGEQAKAGGRVFKMSDAHEDLTGIEQFYEGQGTARKAAFETLTNSLWTRFHNQLANNKDGYVDTLLEVGFTEILIPANIRKALQNEGVNNPTDTEIKKYSNDLREYVYSTARFSGIELTSTTGAAFKDAEQNVATRQGFTGGFEGARKYRRGALVADSARAGHSYEKLISIKKVSQDEVARIDNLKKGKTVRGTSVKSPVNLTVGVAGSLIKTREGQASAVTNLPIGTWITTKNSKGEPRTFQITDEYKRSIGVNF